MKRVKAKPIETEVGAIHATFGDKVDGKLITETSVFMRTHCGDGTFEHGGREFKFYIGVGLNGATIINVKGGRTFAINLEHLIDHAIKAGLVDESVKWEADTKEDS